MKLLLVFLALGVGFAQDNSNSYIALPSGNGAPTNRHCKSIGEPYTQLDATGGPSAWYSTAVGTPCTWTQAAGAVSTGSLPAASGVGLLGTDGSSWTWRSLGSGLSFVGQELSVDASIVGTLSGTNLWTGQNTFSVGHIVAGPGSYTDHSGAGWTAPDQAVTVLPGTCHANIETVILTTTHTRYICDQNGTGWVAGGASSSSPGGSSGYFQYNDGAGGFAGLAPTGTPGNVVLSNSPTIVTPTIASLVNMQHNHSNAAGGGPLLATAVGAGAKQGDGTKFAMASGSFTPGNCVDTDPNGNLIDAGNPCGTGGPGGGSGVGRTTLSFSFPGTVLDGNCSAPVVATWPGVTTGDTVILDSGQYDVVSWVSAADTVSAKVCAKGLDITPGTLSLNAMLGTYGLTGTTSLNLAAILDGNCSPEQTITIGAAAAGDPVTFKAPDLSSYQAAYPGKVYVSGANTVKFTICAAGADVDLPSLTYGAMLAK